MPLSWNEIRDRAVAFSKEWADESSENAEAKTFWDGFFNVFGVTRRRLASFEEPVKRLASGGKTSTGYIDLFWKGQLIVEHKSLGKSLEKAYAQALDYFPGILERDLPRYVLVSDFATLRLYDLVDDLHWDFPLKDLHKQIKRFGFIAGYAPQIIKPQDPVNIRAAEKMGKLHDLLKASGYEGHGLEVLLVRLVFCLFADNTGIFPAQVFRDWLETRTAEDGSDLGPQLAMLFQVLNTPKEKRQKTLDEQIAAFDYVNGRLFEESLQVASFDQKMRATLLDCCALNWGAVSPAIFGALFQSIMDEKARRNLGAHYTSEQNILKVIKSLFLDELYLEFNRVKGNDNRLFEFHKKLRRLVFLDPACGCGNFLVISYRELRKLELEVLRASHASGQRYIEVHGLLSVDVDQFHGIEIEEFPAQIAQVAMWLTDHQMNLMVSEEFGMYVARIPLRTSPHIVHGNALRTDWNDVVSAERVDYILGNPPFIGKQYQTLEQKADLSTVCAGINGAGVLDFVAAWYLKAVQFIRGDGQSLIGLSSDVLPPRDRVKVAFVSTNSITQGEQVSVLWGELLRLGVKIHFAHRTFQWSNEGRGVATVQCVIIGFALFEASAKVIFEYPDARSEPHPVNVGNINPYLVDAQNILLPRKSHPFEGVPEMLYGSKPVDGGNYLLSTDEKDQLLKIEPEAKKFIRPFIGADEFLYGIPRWCIWLRDAQPSDIRDLPEVSNRVRLVAEFRSKSKKAATRAMAKFPTRFGEDRHRDEDYIVIPEVSSENRAYIPIGFIKRDVITSNRNYSLRGGQLFHFGILSSTMHMAWVKYTCGRLESRFTYSSQIVYNNFPWPLELSEKNKSAIEKSSQNVLNARAKFATSTLADLYEPTAMPPELTKAHQELDRVVDLAYGRKNFKSDAERVVFLFELYHNYTSMLPSEIKPQRRKKAT